MKQSRSSRGRPHQLPSPTPVMASGLCDFQAHAPSQKNTPFPRHPITKTTCPRWSSVYRCEWTAGGVGSWVYGLLGLTTAEVLLLVAIPTACGSRHEHKLLLSLSALVLTERVGVVFPNKQAKKQHPPHQGACLELWKGSHPLPLPRLNKNPKGLIGF